jgi:phage I-like protein
MDMLIAASSACRSLKHTKEHKMSDTVEKDEQIEEVEETLAEAEDMPTEEMQKKIADLEEKLAIKEQLVLELEAKLKEYEGQSKEDSEEMKKLNNDLRKQVVELSAKIDNKDKEEIVQRAIALGRIFPAQKDLYMQLSKDALNTEIDKLPLKQRLLTKTDEVIIDTKESEVQKLSAYISAKLKG